MTDPITRAIAWLDTVTDPDGGVHRWLNIETGELGPVSTEITGYAAHLFAWLSHQKGDNEFVKRAVKYAEWLCKIIGNRLQPEAPWPKNPLDRFVPFEPSSDLQYFFDLGIAARGLSAVYEITENDYYLHCSNLIVECMEYHGSGPFVPVINRQKERVIPKPGWWSSEPGPYQMKAAMMITGDPRIELLQWTEWNGDGNLLHPLAYFVEAAYLSGNKIVAAMGTELLGGYLEDSMLHLRFWRTDAYAQWMRLKILQGEPDMQDCVNALIDQQHESGGFHFSNDLGGLSPDLSTHATIFAIQALMMAEGHTTDYKELTIV